MSVTRSAISVQDAIAMTGASCPGPAIIWSSLIDLCPEPFFWRWVSALVHAGVAAILSKAQLDFVCWYREGFVAKLACTVGHLLHLFAPLHGIVKVYYKTRVLSNARTLA